MPTAEHPASPTRHDRVGRLSVRWLFVLGTLLCAAAYALAPLVLERRGANIIGGDATYYYVYARSVVLDGDLDFTNDYAGFDRARAPDDPKRAGGSYTNTGRPLNQFSVGPALFAAPLFVAAHLLSVGLQAAGVRVGADGFGYLEQISFGVAGVLASGAAAWLCYRLARRWYGVGAALGGVLLVWFGGSMAYYTLVSPTYSHAFDACAVTLWLAYWIHRAPATPRQWAIFGLLAGVVTLMRWQQAGAMLLPLGWLVWDALRTRRVSPRAALACGVAYCAAAVVAFVPQMIAWQINFGSPIAVPQGTDFFNLTQPGLWEVLFSTRHGLFTWTPAVLVGLAGLVPLARVAPRPALTGAIAFILLWYLNGTTRDWWGGEAFGQRRFLSLVPFLALGTAAALHGFAASGASARRRVAGGAVAVLIALNLLFLGQYVAFLHGYGRIGTYPTAQEMLLNRFTVPFGYAQRLLRK